MVEKTATIHGKKLSKRPNENKNTNSGGIRGVLCLMFIMLWVWSKCHQSTPSTCDEAVEYYLEQYVPVCREVELERSRYGREPASMTRQYASMFITITNILEEKFGSACTQKFNDKANWTYHCPL